jgi:predicted urease superfamily metal-dependent hydrolase
MAYYRIYSLDLMGRHFIDVQHFEADGDADAISKVGHGVLGVSRELWNLGRKVMDFAQ